MILALTLALCAQTPTPAVAPRAASPAEQRAYDRAKAGLSSNKELLGLYRSFRAFLASDTELRQAEENFQALLEMPGFRAPVDNFEEVLRADATARANFEGATERLHRDPALRDAVKALDAVESDALRARGDLGPAFARLRAQPDLAHSLIANPGATMRWPADLARLSDLLNRNTTLRARLRDAWTRLDAASGAREALYPWWARAYAGGGAAARAWRSLEAEQLAPFPSRKVVFEERELAWAAHPDGVAWRDHLYARIRRDPALAQDFFSFLRVLRVRPGTADQTERDFAATNGPPGGWPPSGTPPSLAGWTPKKTAPRPSVTKPPIAPSTNMPAPREFRRPTTDKPTGPTRPSPPAPSRPTSPADTKHF